MSDADNQIGGTGEPFSKRDQGDGASSPEHKEKPPSAAEPKEAEQPEDADKPE